MEKVVSVPYKTYEIMVFRDDLRFFFTIAKNGQLDKIFSFTVMASNFPAEVSDENPYEEQFQICMDHIDIITKSYQFQH